MKIVKLLSAVVALMVLAGCGNSYEGTDSAVQETVIQLARDNVRDKLSARAYVELTHIPIDILKLQADYAFLKQKAASDNYAKQALAQVDKVMAKMRFALKNIRTDKIDHNVKKSYNSADLEISSDSSSEPFPINFTAQKTKDGIYVEVSQIGK
ncbi:MAG: hypothetical protein PHV82_18880 [Victivallaceae bacterium]|nr:hypothetical protein [Victivallaceae bacterium]